MGPAGSPHNQSYAACLVVGVVLVEKELAVCKCWVNAQLTRAKVHNTPVHHPPGGRLGTANLGLDNTTLPMEA